MAGKDIKVSGSSEIFEPVPEGEELGDAFDPLSELLSMNTAREIVEEVKLKRFSKTWKLKSLSNELNDELTERCTRYKRNRAGQQIKELDAAKYSRLVVYNCLVEPKLDDERLYQKYGLKKGYGDEERLVQKVLFPGEIDRLFSKIMEISGFEDDLVEVGKG